MNTSPKPEDSAALFYSIVKSLNTFNSVEVKGVIDTLLSPTPPENCFIGLYYRAIGNVETLLTFGNSKSFQAALMLARALFELAIDIRLLKVIPQAWVKMISFTDVERLRCAKKIVKFKAANPTFPFDTTIIEAFITRNEKSIDAKHHTLWPTLRRVRHWSGLDLSSRVALLKEPFQEIYEVDYPIQSWFAHSGLTGVVNQEPEAFVHLSARAFKLAADAYWEILQAMIREFKISSADEKIEKKMEYAKKVSFTDSPEQAEELLKALLR